ncbi:MAG TPA: hypothetical protein VI912_04480 [Candidatus Bilamarchaeaceae archaeon]|nr:hypothetical protein [Candidatus Bilamarchaeaceae archaeon]
MVTIDLALTEACQTIKSIALFFLVIFLIQTFIVYIEGKEKAHKKWLLPAAVVFLLLLVYLFTQNILNMIAGIVKLELAQC